MRRVLCSFWSLVIILLSVSCLEICRAQNENEFSRDDFPPEFIFGSGSSAYQVEGAANEDGRTPSIWDTYTHSGKIPNNGDIAADQYHRYKEDVKLMVDTGLDAYRFSISWPRLIPNGRGPVNPKGLEYYNNLINELISHGIQAHATLFHYDLPQALEDEYEGWLSRKIVKDFTAYADVCFKEFGDRVSTWTTMNKYQAKQHGLIGFNLFGYGLSPVTNSTEDIAATRRANDFYMGWFVEPFVLGDYPESMKRNVGSRLPAFTPYEAKLVNGSCDFFGVNHYASIQIKDNPQSLLIQTRDYITDMAVQFISNWSGEGVLPVEFPVMPSGLQEVLEYFKQGYGNPPIYIHENGRRMLSAPRETSMKDTSRVNYLKGYIGGLLDALRY